MAIYGVFTNPYIWINNVDLADHIEQVTLNFSSETPDATAFGQTTRINKGGLKVWDIEFRCQQDFNAAKIDATFFTLVGTSACFEIRPTNTCTTATNPSFTGIGVVESYPPMGGQIGDVLKATMKMVSASALSRASSS